MTVEQRCDRTDLLVSACAHCRPTSPPADVTVEGADRRITFLARHDGYCSCGCGGEILAGLSVIIRTADGWALEECG